MPEGFAYCRMIYDTGGAPSDWIYVDVPASAGLIGISPNVDIWQDLSILHYPEVEPVVRGLVVTVVQSSGRV